LYLPGQYCHANASNCTSQSRADIPRINHVMQIVDFIICNFMREQRLAQVQINQSICNFRQGAGNTMR